jgi:2-amino-4-ketopentanoate thiolase beta subunit
MTEALANLEGLEKGPAGNTALAAAFCACAGADQDSSSSFRKPNTPEPANTFSHSWTLHGITASTFVSAIPKRTTPGKNIILPSHPSFIKCTDADLDQPHEKISYKKALKTYNVAQPTAEDIHSWPKKPKRRGIRGSVLEL